MHIVLDRFIFTPYGSPSWKRGYRRRTALERINARLDRSFEFEQPFIRGLSRICPWSLGPTRCYASLTEGLVRLLGVSDRSLLLSPPL